MAKYFVLIKRKSSKRYLGAIPARSGVSLAKLRSNVSKRINKKYTYRIVTQAQLKSFIKRTIIIKKTRKRKTVRRKIKRTKKRR